MRPELRPSPGESVAGGPRGACFIDTEARAGASATAFLSPAGMPIQRQAGKVEMEVDEHVDDNGKESALPFRGRPPGGVEPPQPTESCDLVLHEVGLGR